MTQFEIRYDEILIRGEKYTAFDEPKAKFKKDHYLKYAIKDGEINPSPINGLFAK